MKTLFKFLQLFGIQKVEHKHYYQIGTNTKIGTIYFKAFKKGVPQFTFLKEFAWKFTSKSEAVGCFEDYASGLVMEIDETCTLPWKISTDQLFVEEIRR